MSDAEAADRFAESISVRLLLEDLGLRERPARSTLVENLNAVSNGTRELLLDCQLADILAEGLDDFRELTVDSTAVKGCSAHPNEARLAWAFLERAARLLANLAKAGHGRFLPGWTEAWLGEMKQLAFEINTVRGKASGHRRKTLYRQLLARGDKVFAHLHGQAAAAFAGWQSGAGVRPYRIHARLQETLAQVMADSRGGQTCLFKRERWFFRIEGAHGGHLRARTRSVSAIICGICG